jgi:TolA-binding protein
LKPGIPHKQAKVTKMKTRKLLKKSNTIPRKVRIKAQGISKTCSILETIASKFVDGAEEQESLKLAAYAYQFAMINHKQAFEDYLHIVPDMEARFDAAIAFRNKGQFHEAMLVLKTFIKKYPMYAFAHLFLGDTLSELGKTKEASVAFFQAVKLNPTSEVCSLGLFHSLFDTGQIKAAVSEGRRFLKLKPSSSYRKMVKELEMELPH